MLEFIPKSKPVKYKIYQVSDGYRTLAISHQIEVLVAYIKQLQAEDLNQCKNNKSEYMFTAVLMTKEEYEATVKNLIEIDKRKTRYDEVAEKQAEERAQRKAKASHLSLLH